ncbi:MAG: holo-ACP synthase [Nitrospirota bacterium]|jgi:holo-[acyl-carrier protein] synthase
MIHGVGVDIIEVDRIRRSVADLGEKFLERVFTEDELEHCRRHRDPHPHYAGRFAAKEALVKALSTEAPISLRDVEVTNDPKGKPVFKVSKKLQILFDEKGIVRTHLSLSHERTYAVATVVLEKLA